jgi:hypothetical protein
MIFKCEKSTGYSLSAPAVITPKGCGYKFSEALKADFPISQKPGHSSTQTEHIPLAGVLSLGVLFFVRVAADAFGFENDIFKPLSYE